MVFFFQDSSSPLPPLIIEHSDPIEKDFEVGLRLTNISYFFERLQSISNHQPGFGCNITNLKIVSEFRQGLDSKLTLLCNMCGESFKVSLVEETRSAMNLNQRMVAGVMSCGSGHSHLQTITASVGLPALSLSLYSKTHNEICNWWEMTAAQCMSDAVKEEADYAISVGNVNKNGVPLISVAVDGCWSKRSYGKNYSALSGAAAIVGLHFGKVLYLGVKNKYCYVCARNANKSEPVDHICFMNYSGPSSGMEAKIIVEGFKRSLQDHGVIFNQFVADGDASTYKKILDARPYGDLIVEKIECKNHLLRNYCNALVKLSQDTKFPPEFRKILKDRYMRLRTGVVCAIRHWSNQDLAINQKISNLSKDILNSPQHIFGDHENCKEYFCTPEKRRPEPIGLLPQLISCGLLSAIQNLNKKLSYHARSLIHNVTSNLVESFNAQIAKYVGGKRINYSLRRSYAGRCAAGVVSFNTGTLHTATHNVIFKSEPNNLILNLEKNRKKWTKKYKNKTKLKKRKAPVLKDANYGENAQQPDMRPEVFDAEKIVFLNDLKLSLLERQELERSTVMQRNSAEWMSRRRKLLTSSSFGEVCKKRDSTSCVSLVTKIVYGGNLSTVPAIRYGIDNEEVAIKQLEKQENITIENCGLFVDEQYPFLGTTPDGKYGEDGLVEIKCPSSLANFSLEDAYTKHAIWKYNKDLKIYELNKNHNWYFQIQGQLHITKFQKCLLGIWFGESMPMKVYLIQRDDLFWESKMETKLVKFYYDCLLPELVDPRHARCMPIRDQPNFKKSEKKKPAKKKDLTMPPNTTSC